MSTAPGQPGLPPWPTHWSPEQAGRDQLRARPMPDVDPDEPF